MKWIPVLTALLVFCIPVLSHGQEIRDIPPAGDTVPAISQPDYLPSGSLDIKLAPLELNTITAPDALPRADYKEISAMQKKIISEIPRYPTVKLWDGQNASPFLYSSRNSYMGLDMGGMGTRIDITDWLAADINVFISGAYMGPMHPNRYMNASLSTALEFKLHDRVSIIATGEISAREGLHPKYAPGFGGKNSVGVMGVFWITDGVGIGFGHTWEWYQGGWYGHYNYGPMQRHMKK